MKTEQYKDGDLNDDITNLAVAQALKDATLEEIQKAFEEYFNEACADRAWRAMVDNNNPKTIKDKLIVIDAIRERNET